MDGGAIAATLNTHRKKNGSDADVDAPHEQGRSMLKRVLDDIERQAKLKQGYCFLFAFLFQFVLYTGILFGQRSIEAAFMVEEAVKGGMFSEVTNTIEVASGEIVTNLDGADHFYEWFEINFVNATFADPKCGNGECESPIETKAWQGFGCQADCGAFPKASLTHVYIQLTLNITESEDANEYRDAYWQVCSKAHGICIFEDYMPFPGNGIRGEGAADLPDGDWTVYLQTRAGGISGRVYYYDGQNGETDLVTFDKCKEYSPWEDDPDYPPVKRIAEHFFASNPAFP